MEEKGRRADLISVEELSQTVRKAVGQIKADLPGLEGKPVIARWDLVGFIGPDFDFARKAAPKIAEQVSRSGIDAKAAVLSIGDDIIFGFFPPKSVPPIHRL